MTLTELRSRIDGLIALGYGDEEVVVQPDDGWHGAPPVPLWDVADRGTWYVSDAVSSEGEGWVALLYSYRPAAGTGS